MTISPTHQFRFKLNSFWKCYCVTEIASICALCIFYIGIVESLSLGSSLATMAHIKKRMWAINLFSEMKKRFERNAKIQT